MACLQDEPTGCIFTHITFWGMPLFGEFKTSMRAELVLTSQGKLCETTVHIIFYNKDVKHTCIIKVLISSVESVSRTEIVLCHVI